MNSLTHLKVMDSMENLTARDLLTEDQNRSERWTNAKEGDVFYALNGSWTWSQTLKVVRATKTLIILDNGVRLNKATRKESNIGYTSMTSYVPATPGAVRLRAEAFAAKDLKARSIRALNLATGLGGNADFVTQLEKLIGSFEETV